jgi:lipoprotein-anchoring transpeptidase ErfK/SrfK
MRKLLMLLTIAMLPVLAMPQGQATAAKPTEQELLVLKKKQAEAARKAAAKKQAEIARRAAAKKQAAIRKATAADRTAHLVARQVVNSNRKPVARQQAAVRRSCAGLLSCMFGTKPRSGVRRASTAGTSDDYSTSDVVDWNAGTKYAPGSIVVKTPERALYLVMGDGRARRYSVGVGREGFQWSGNSRIVSKQEWPTWRPPQVMIEREAAKGHFLPDVMEGGPENPLGARALYIGGTLYRIHGTNNSSSIGGAVSSGCIRMMNSDVVDLYDRVKVGAKVYVYQ